jgi:hypothetical protein
VSSEIALWLCVASPTTRRARAACHGPAHVFTTASLHDDRTTTSFAFSAPATTAASTSAAAVQGSLGVGAYAGRMSGAHGKHFRLSRL